MAQLMRATKATARRYLTDEAIAGMAESIAFSLAEEASGAGLHGAPRTAPVPLYYVGRMVARLTEAARSASPNETAPSTRRLASPSWSSACRSSAASPAPSRPMAMGPKAPMGTLGSRWRSRRHCWRRVARYLDAAAVAAEDGATPAGFDEDPVKLARVFRDDATMLRILPEAGGPSGRPNLRAL